MTNPNPKRSTVPAEPQGGLKLFRLVPIALDNDPRWDLATNQGEVVVRAYSPADARIVAVDAEIDFMDVDAVPGHSNTTKMASAFRDDKLYTVVDEPPGQCPLEGPREVVLGVIERAVITPVADDES